MPYTSDTKKQDKEVKESISGSTVSNNELKNSTNKFDSKETNKKKNKKGDKYISSESFNSGDS